MCGGSRSRTLPLERGPHVLRVGWGWGWPGRGDFGISLCSGAPLHRGGKHPQNSGYSRGRAARAGAVSLWGAGEWCAEGGCLFFLSLSQGSRDDRYHRAGRGCCTPAVESTGGRSNRSAPVASQGFKEFQNGGVTVGVIRSIFEGFPSLATSQSRVSELPENTESFESWNLATFQNPSTLNPRGPTEAGRLSGVCCDLVRVSQAARAGSSTCAFLCGGQVALP